MKLQRIREEAQWWVDKSSEKINAKWNIHEIIHTPKPFVPKPKPKEYKQWIKKWTIHCKKTLKPKFRVKQKPE
jgi:hypothetical protein